MREDILKALDETKLVAIIRGMDPEICVRLAEAYVEGGIRLVEVTFDQTGAPAKTVAAIRAIKSFVEWFPMNVTFSCAIKVERALSNHC